MEKKLANTGLIIYESESYYRMLDEVKRIVKDAIREAQKNSNSDEWLSAEEAKKLLGIKSKSKLQSLRDNFEIAFSQHGRIIRYSKNSINEFLQKKLVKY